MQRHAMHIKAHMQENAMHRKVHMQWHAIQGIGKCVCRGMQYNAGENAYTGACNVMHSKVHMQEQCNEMHRKSI